MSDEQPPDSWEDALSESETEKEAREVAAAAAKLAEKERKKKLKEEKREMGNTQKPTTPKVMSAEDAKAAAERAGLQDVADLIGTTLDLDHGDEQEQEEEEQDDEGNAPAQRQNTVDQFDGLGIGSLDGREAPQAPLKIDLNTYNPKTAQQFTIYQEALVQRILPLARKFPKIYPEFTEKLVRELIAPVHYLETRKLSTLLNTVANDQQKKEKDGKTKGGKGGIKKATIKVAAPMHKDLNDYGGDVYADEFDFM